MEHSIRSASQGPGCTSVVLGMAGTSLQTGHLLRSRVHDHFVGQEAQQSNSAVLTCVARTSSLKACRVTTTEKRACLSGISTGTRYFTRFKRNSMPDAGSESRFSMCEVMIHIMLEAINAGSHNLLA